jgi:aminocarboxymuconate-semialdehyde decarboxylase
LVLHSFAAGVAVDNKRANSGEGLMPDRRSFLKTAAYASAAAIALGACSYTAAKPDRRRISIGGQRVKVVDIHAHCGIPAVEKVVSRTPLAMTVGNSRLLGSGRLEALDERGIDMQALSVNQYWWYAADVDLARRITRTQDEGLAEWCAQYPDRFVPLSTVSLQHPALAAEQLEYAVTELDHRGASIGGHVNGTAPSGERFDPFWAKAEELGVPVFMHPTGAEHLIKEGQLDGRGALGNIIGNPLETTTFLSHMIFDGTFDRFPTLKVCAAHGGGYLPSYLGRTDVACEFRENADCANKKRPSEYLRSQILADSMVFTDEGLRHLVAEMGVGQVVYGSDLPFNWPDTLDVILNASYLSDAEKKAILGGNLMKLLRIA